MLRACYKLRADYIHQKNSGSSERNTTKIQVKRVGSLRCVWATVTRSVTVSLLNCQNASKFVFLQAFSFIKTIQWKVLAKPLSNNKNRPPLLDMCCSKPFLLEFTNSKTSDLPLPDPNKLNFEQHECKWVFFGCSIAEGGGREKGEVKRWNQSQ